MNFVLRIVFALLAAACVACCVFIFIYFSWWGLIPLVGAVVFAILAYVYRERDHEDEVKEVEAHRSGDFIKGPVHKKTPEEIAAEEAAAIFSEDVKPEDDAAKATDAKAKDAKGEAKKK